MGSTKHKSDTLGMPHGTAQHRLRKMILFDLLKRHEENVCYRCGEKIDDIDDLSIEHKEPWEGRSADLYWDLNNIAFSHLDCNRPHTCGSTTKLRKVGSEGTSWCGVHQAFEPIENFTKNAYRWHGRELFCKDAAADKRKEIISKQVEYSRRGYQKRVQRKLEESLVV